MHGLCSLEKLSYWPPKICIFFNLTVRNKDYLGIHNHRIAIVSREKTKPLLTKANESLQHTGAFYKQKYFLALHSKTFYNIYRSVCSNWLQNSLKMSEMECRSLQSSVKPKSMSETDTEMPKATTSCHNKLTIMLTRCFCDEIAQIVP
jgi:hypothetical protein